MAELIFQGKKVHYEVHGSGGEPIVLLNGIMMSTASWKPFIESMTKHNTLVLVDFFDQGQSERMTESYDHSIQVELLDAVLEEVAAQIWYEKFNIMGISYGGEVAIQYALQHPNRVRRLVLANTCGRTSSWLKKIGDGWNEVAKTGQGYAYYLTTIPVIYSTQFFEDRAAWMEGREAFLESIEKSGGSAVGNSRERFQCISIIGQIEGHYALPEGQKATKYEHLIPQLVEIEEDE